MAEKRELTSRARAAILADREAGVPVAEIAAKRKWSRSTVCRVIYGEAPSRRPGAKKRRGPGRPRGGKAKLTQMNRALRASNREAGKHEVVWEAVLAWMREEGIRRAELDADSGGVDLHYTRVETLHFLTK